MQVLKKGLGRVNRFDGLRVAIVLLTLFLSLALPQAAASAPGTWAYTVENLTTARKNHTATLLPDGQVLVVGGATHFAPYVYFTSVERFDLAAGGTWTTVEPIPFGRFYHTATLLKDGTVLVAGGITTEATRLTSAQLYDPVENTWTATDDLKKAMAGHTATLLNDGRVFVFGGFANEKPEIYDPVDRTWSEVEPTAVPSNHIATLLPDGKVLVAGGSNGVSLNTAEIYDPILDIWTPAASLKHAREYHTATPLPNGKVLVAGGYDSSSGYLNSAELYDPIGNTWTDTGSLSEARQEHQAVMLDNGQVLVVGGLENTIGMASAELYNPVNGKWSPTGSLNTGRLWFTATRLNNGQVLAASGYGSNPYSLKNTAELYDPPPPPPSPANPGLMLLLWD